MKLSILVASIVGLVTLTAAHAFQASAQLPSASEAKAVVQTVSPALAIGEIADPSGAGAWGRDGGYSEAKIQLAQYQDHTWNPNWGAPYNPGVVVQDNRPKGYWEYQYYYIQTKGTNGFIIIYYNLVCAGAGKRCPPTSAPSSCYIAGGWLSDCDTSIPRNL